MTELDHRSRLSCSRHRAGLAQALLATVLVLALAACGEAEPAAPEAGGGPPVHALLFSVDTLRADRLGVYGYGPPTSPSIDAWAAQATVFDQAASAAPWTIPSFASLFTGKYPHEVGAIFNYRSALDPSAARLGRLFQDAGFRTAAFNGHPILLRPRQGFMEGFAEIFPQGRPKEKVPFADFAPAIEQWLAAADPAQPTFVWVHLMETHSPPTPDNPWVGVFRRRYDAEVRLADDAFAQVLAAYRDAGMLHRTLIVFVADHGEAFGEHGASGHQNNLFDEVMRVPMIVKVPGAEQVSRVPAAVEVLDLFPTLLEAMGIEPPPHRGESLLPLIRGETERRDREFQFAERFFVDGQHHFFARSDRFKLYQTLPASPQVSESNFQPDDFDWDPRRYVRDDEAEYRLYALGADPQELDDVAAQAPSTVREMRRALGSWFLETPPDGELPAGGDDEDALATLKALGYLQD